jgi:hypothetical protein
MPCSIAVDSLFDYPFHPRHQLLISCVFMKSLLKRLPIVFKKTFHVPTFSHNLDTLHDFSLVFANEFQSEEEKHLEMKKNI